MEEIDIIFARGFVEADGVEREGGRADGGKMRWRGDRYVRAAREMKYLSDEEIEAEQRRYGLVDESGEVRGCGSIIEGSKEV